MLSKMQWSGSVKIPFIFHTGKKSLFNPSMHIISTYIEDYSVNGNSYITHDSSKITTNQRINISKGIVVLSLIKSVKDTVLSF